MKTIIILTCIPIFLMSCNTHKLAKTDVPQFEWLVGKWQRQEVNPEQTAFELWERNPSGGLSGIGATLRGLDTVFIENLSLIEKEGSYFYVADVAHNPAPVYFKISDVSKNGFTCENPEHDFPKKLVYSKKGIDLTVIISGGEKEVPFFFKKLD